MSTSAECKDADETTKLVDLLRLRTRWVGAVTWKPEERTLIVSSTACGSSYSRDLPSSAELRDDQWDKAAKSINKVVLRDFEIEEGDRDWFKWNKIEVTTWG